MKSILLFAITLFLFSPFCFAQRVWPGDVNNNGVVNGIDLLYIAFALDEEGSSRTNATSDWIDQELPTEWEGTFPSGLNFAFADCDGNGKVNSADIEVIRTNLNLTHDDVEFVADEILEATTELGPTFSFNNEVITVAPGIQTDAQILLGDSLEGNLKNILGISFTITLDPMFFDTSSSQFVIDPVSWFIPFAEEAATIISENPTEGKIRVTTVKTDQMPAMGSGGIGKVSFIIVEDIIDFLAPTDTITIQIDSITVVTDDLTKIPVAGATLVIDIEGRTTSTYDPILDKVKFYPNPNNGWILLQTNEVPIEKVEVVNTLGQTVYQQSLTKNNFHSLDLNHVPEGAYWLRMITEFGIKSTPIQKYN